MSTTDSHIARRQKDSSLSYKFQRLRERIRQAIASGELSGKLPGERSLARAFQVNAKTLSKALTDLAAEGVLDRSIGRGTYVKGHAPAPAIVTGRWLVLADPGCWLDLIAGLRQHNEQLQVVTESVANVRPSFINQFSAVIDIADDTPEPFLRDMVVRNLPVVAVNREPRTYSMHAVTVDRPLGAARLARQMLLAGHRHFAVVSTRGDVGVVDAVRQTAKRFGQESIIDAIAPADVLAAVENGATGLICDATVASRDVAERLGKAGVPVPARVSLAAVGTSDGGTACSGYYVSTEQMIQAVAELLANPAGARPATLWLAGDLVDAGSIGTTAAPLGALDVAADAPNFTMPAAIDPKAN